MSNAQNTALLTRIAVALETIAARDEWTVDPVVTREIRIRTGLGVMEARELALKARGDVEKAVSFVPRHQRFPSCRVHGWPTIPCTCPVPNV